MDVKKTYSGDHFAIYIHNKHVRLIQMLCVDYISILNRQKIAFMKGYYATYIELNTSI